MRGFSLFLALLSLTLVPAYASTPMHEFRPITEKEKQLFYPLVCANPATSEDGWDRACNDSVLGSPAADGPALLKFDSIAYGSFTTRSTKEAVILFHSNIGGEVDRGLGAVVFKRQHNRWTLEKSAVESLFSECLVFPTQHLDKLFCLDQPMLCCGSYSSVATLFSFPDLFQNVPRKSWRLLSVSDGHLDYPEVGVRGDFCAAAAADKPRLITLDHLQKSKSGAFADAHIDYVLPEESKLLCSETHDRERKYIDGQVRFVRDGEVLKVVLPDGITSFAN